MHEKRHLTIRALQANLPVSVLNFPAHPGPEQSPADSASNHGRRAIRLTRIGALEITLHSCVNLHSNYMGEDDNHKSSTLS